MTLKLLRNPISSFPQAHLIIFYQRDADNNKEKLTGQCFLSRKMAYTQDLRLAVLFRSKKKSMYTQIGAIKRFQDGL